MRSSSLIRLLFAIGCCAAVTANCTAQETEDKAIDSLSERTDNFFFDLTTQSEPKSAFENLFIGGPLRDPARDAEVMELVERYERLGEKYGVLVGKPERISVKRFGEDLVLLKYLYKAEKFPIVWCLTYYRPQRNEIEPSKGWFVVSLRFDTRLELLDLTE